MGLRQRRGYAARLGGLGAAVTLALAACGTGSGAPTTVTKIVTPSAGPPATAAGSPGGSSTGITVIDPNAVNPSAVDQSGGRGSDQTGGQATSRPGSAAPTTGPGSGPTSQAEGAPTSGTGPLGAAPSGNAPQETASSGTSPSETPSGTSSPGSGASATSATSPPKTAGVNCASLLMSGDIRSALGKSIPRQHLRIVDKPNPDIGLTAKIRCYYGTSDLSDGYTLVAAVAQYRSADAAENQLDVTAGSEERKGAVSRTATVDGKQADILLRDGGLLMLRVDDWTLSIAIDNGVVSNNNAVAGALQILAKAALSRLA